MFTKHHRMKNPCLNSLSLLSKHHQREHHRWRYFTHQRRNQTICNPAEREAFQRSQNSGCDWLCKLGIFLKWCSSACKWKGKGCVFSNRRFCHSLMTCNRWFKRTVLSSERDVSMQMHAHLVPRKKRDGEERHRMRPQANSSWAWAAVPRQMSGHC